MDFRKTSCVSQPFERIAILAPGLLGASVAAASHARGVSNHISIWARRPETRLEIESQPWCHSTHVLASEAVADADLVVLCAPVDVIPRLAGEISPALKANALVTDVGSVKGDLCRLASHALAGRAAFIGSHPMAGSELTGWRAASAELFTDRPCFITPLPDADPLLTDRLARFWSGLGANVTTTTPDLHDEIVAQISHLPHLASATLAATLGRHKPGWGTLSGNGLRDTTRIAAGDPELWRAIIESNQPEILAALRRFQATLDELHSAIANRDAFALTNLLRDAKRFRDSLPPRP